MRLLAHAGLSHWPFGDLQPHSYGMIMADPAWTFRLRSGKGEAKSAQAQYQTMTLDEIKAMPVLDLAAADCLLWLWATAPMIDQQIDVMKAWGFRFSTEGIWVKTTKSGKVRIGTGYRFRGSHEPILIGTRGNPPVAARNISSVIFGLARRHSRKPDEAYEVAERMAPGVKRLDLFSRQNRKNWDSWGDECGLFDDEDMH